MKSYLINNLYLVFFNPSEFPYFFEEYRSRSSEFLVAILSASSISIGTLYLNVPYDSFSEILIFPFFISHLFFFTVLPILLAYLYDHKMRQDGKNGDYIKLLSFIRYAIGILSFFLPFCFFVNLIGLKGSSSFLLLSFILFFSFLMITSVGASEIYKTKVSQSFSYLLSSCTTILFLPIFLFLYYLGSFLGIILK